MVKLKYKTSLLMTSGLLLLTSFAHAADDDFEAQLQHALRLSEQTAAEEAALRQSHAESRSSIQQVEISYDDQLRIALALSAEESSPKKEPIEQHGTKQRVVTSEDNQRRQKEAQVLLAKYIMGKPSQIRSNAQYFVEAIEEFLEHPDCFSGMGDSWKERVIKEDPLQLKSIRQKEQNYFQEFCEKENLSYGTVLPLFSAFWDRIEQNEFIKAFRQANQQLKKAIEDNESSIKTLLQNENFFVNFDENTKVYKKKIESFGLVDLYHKIYSINSEVSRFINSLAQEGPEQFLAQSPAINWSLLLNKQEVVRPTAGKAEDKKPKIFMRPVLEDSLIGFQKTLNFEFESRQGKGGDETVMYFASKVAKVYHEEIERNINKIWDKIDFPPSSAHPVNNIGQIIELHNRAKAYLGHGDVESREIGEILQTSYTRHKENPMTVYLGNKTQYDYLRMVFAQVLRLDEEIRKQDDEKANEFLSFVFSVLLGQMEEYPGGTKKIACQGGMTGRLFQIHKMTLDRLIEYYNNPVKMGE